MHSNRQIQQKITNAILLTSTAVLLLTGLAYITYEYFTFHKSTLNKISVLGEVISNNSTAALAFDSKDDAYEILSALKAEEDVVVAALYDENGVLFSNYPKTLHVHDLPKKVVKTGYSFIGEYIEGFQPVILGSKQIGTLYLKYDLKVLKREYILFGFIAFLILVLSLILVYFLSSQLQKRISGPIMELANFARSISIHKNYSVRTVKQSDDEIGLLSDSFNQMLVQIEQQNMALQESEKNFRTLADNIPNLCWMANEKGRVFWYNKRWYDYTGMNANEIHGWDVASIHDNAFLPEIMKRWENSIKTGKSFEMVFPLKGEDDIFRPFLTRVNPVVNNAGKIVRWFGTSTDITIQIKAEENLENKNKELTKINNDLDNFIYTASHDLKSPVSNLEGLLNMITDEDEGMVTEKAKDILPLLSQSILRLKTVIMELAEIARIQKDTDILRDEIVLDEIFNEALDLLDTERKKYNGEIHYDFSQAPKIKFSRKNLRSILYNLLSNAIKYSSPEITGEITMRTEIVGNYIMLTIKDNGLGIPENQFEKIFIMFKRYHTHVEGTGVGLYIIKRIIENSGGKIEVQSEEGKGSTFKIFFKR